MRASVSRLFALGTLLTLAGCALVLGLDDHELASAGTGSEGGSDGPNGGEGGPGADGGDGGDATVRDGAVTDVVVLATGQMRPSGIAVDATRIYWANQDDGTIKALDRGSAAPNTFAADATTPIGVAIDTSDVFWTSNTGGGCNPKDGIWRRAKNGASQARLEYCNDAMGVINGLAIDAVNVYWTNGRVFAVPKVGGGLILLTENIGSPKALAVGPLAVYWTNPQAKNVGRLWKDDGGVGVLVPDQQGLAAIATDGTNVYYTTLSAVMRVPAEGGTAASLGPVLNGPVALALDDGNAYVATGDGTIVRIPKAGGPEAVLVKGEAGIRSIAVDGSGVYWTTNDDVRMVAFR